MKKKAIRDAYGEALVELGEINRDVVVLDADVSSSTKTVYFSRRFPERFFNVGIAEANMMGIAAGFATAGKIPFANTFSFLTALRAADPVRSLIAQNHLNVKIGGAYSGLSDSYDGASHHSINDIAVMRSLPNMTVVVVSDPVETRKAVFAAAGHKGPVFLRLSRAEFPYIFNEDSEFHLGKARVMKQGRDLTIFATGYMVSKSLEAVEILKGMGIDAELVEIHTIKPIDRQAILDSVMKTRAAITVEEHSIIGGLGSAVLEVLNGQCRYAFERIGLQDVFAESGDYEQLLAKYGLSTQNIVAKARSVLDSKVTLGI